jgi:hypothetical protein
MKSAPLQQTDLGWLTSRSGDPIFWTPERLGRPSAWWGHVPFAFWLTAQCKPRLLVELGTDCGVSYAAFCETVLRLGLATRCFAVDTWQGDAHAGHYGGEVYLDLAEFHERRYGAFSRLLRRTFDDARAEFADATIDLLHIDGYHTYEAVRHDFDAWRPKLSERAVVLFHDSNERRDDFGVWRLFDELKRDAPSFEFLHCHGLGVLALGADAPEAIKALCALAADDEIAVARERFSQLGAHWIKLAESQAQVEELAERAQRLEETNRVATTRCETLASEMKRQREDQTRLLATLKRPDYDGRLPAKLTGLRRWIPGRRRKLRWRAREYRTVAASPLFDRDWYLANNPDVATAKLNPVYHYLRYGAREGRAPGPHFSGQAYKRANPDVADSGENPLLHFIRVGAREGRSPGYGLNGAELRSPLDAAAYREWVRRYDTLSEADRQAIAEHLARLSYQPLISVVMPAFDTPEATFRQAIESVRGQLYQNWELCVADDASPSTTVSAVLAEYAALDHRIKWARRSENGHISAASNSALELARGEFVALMDHDDLIPPHALYEVVAELNAHPEADILYSDEDKIDERGGRYEPYFKTDWNPELFLGQNFISHLGAYRRSLVLAAGGFRVGFEGSQDYDLALRCIRKTNADRIRHIPAVLYHWRKGAGRTSFSDRQLERCAIAARRSKNEYLASIGDPGNVVAHSKAPLSPSEAIFSLRTLQGENDFGFWNSLNRTIFDGLPMAHCPCK